MSELRMVKDERLEAFAKSLGTAAVDIEESLVQLKSFYKAIYLIQRMERYLATVKTGPLEYNQLLEDIRQYLYS